ncbi:hypothetical protein BaRGS_00032210, partial [Batillaria attramentaria]
MLLRSCLRQFQGVALQKSLVIITLLVVVSIFVYALRHTQHVQPAGRSGLQTPGRFQPEYAADSELSNRLRNHTDPASATVANYSEEGVSEKSKPNNSNDHPVVGNVSVESFPVRPLLVLFTTWIARSYKTDIHNNVLRTWRLWRPHVRPLLFSEQSLLPPAHSHSFLPPTVTPSSRPQSLLPPTHSHSFLPPTVTPSSRPQSLLPPAHSHSFLPPTVTPSSRPQSLLPPTHSQAQGTLSFDSDCLSFCDSGTLPPPSVACGGVPILRDMFLAAMAKYPQTQLFGFVNGDLLLGTGLLVTMETVSRERKMREGPVLLILRRYNLDFTGRSAVDDLHEVDEMRAKAHAVSDGSSDGFFTNRLFPWRHMPDVVPGRLGVAMWLVAAARALNITVIDVTPTVTAIHMTSSMGGHESHHHPNKTCNRKLYVRTGIKPSNYGCGWIHCAPWQTVSSGGGDVRGVEIVAKKQLRGICYNCYLNTSLLSLTPERDYSG